MNRKELIALHHCSRLLKTLLIKCDVAKPIETVGGGTKELYVEGIVNDLEVIDNYCYKRKEELNADSKIKEG